MFAATKSFFTNEATSGALAPSWVLDFSVGTPSGYTFTRSANTATYVDSSGYIASANADVARLTHDKNGTRLGLLVEGSSTNIMQYSETFSNAYWTKTNATIDDNGGSFWTSPANASDAVLLTQNTTTGAHNILRTQGSQTAFNFSIFAKKQNTTGGSGRAGKYVTLMLRGNASNYYHATFDLDAGTMTQDATVGTDIGSGASGIEDYGNGWYRCHVRGTRAVAGIAAGYVCLATNDSNGTPTMSSAGQSYAGANSTDGVYIWGAMYEAVNNTPSSYIETPTNATVTRNNDLAYVLDSGITGWQSPGGLVVHFYPPNRTGTIIATEDAIAEQLGIQCNTKTSARAYWSSGNTSTSTLTTGIQKAVHYWNGTASSFCLNSGTVHTGTNNVTTFGNIDFVTFGAQASDNAGIPGLYSSFTNVIIRKIEFYGQSLTSADLQTITA